VEREINKLAQTAQVAESIAESLPGLLIEYGLVHWPNPWRKGERAKVRWTMDDYARGVLAGDTRMVEELFVVLDAAYNAGLIAFHPLTGDLVVTNGGQRAFNDELNRKRAELGIGVPVKDIPDVGDEFLFGDERSPTDPV
jgi:hypothetical protein